MQARISYRELTKHVGNEFKSDSHIPNVASLCEESAKRTTWEIKTLFLSQYIQLGSINVERLLAPRRVGVKQN